jgi:uncharacterized protein with PIN domain
MLQQLHDSVIAWVRHGGGCAWTAACHFLDQQAILTLSWDQHLADGAARAYAQFGRSPHPSGLNFDDLDYPARSAHAATATRPQIVQGLLTARIPSV